MKKKCSASLTVNFTGRNLKIFIELLQVSAFYRQPSSVSAYIFLNHHSGSVCLISKHSLMVGENLDTCFAFKKKKWFIAIIDLCEEGVCVLLVLAQ